MSALLEKYVVSISSDSNSQSVGNSVKANTRYAPKPSSLSNPVANTRYLTSSVPKGNFFNPWVVAAYAGTFLLDDGINATLNLYKQKLDERTKVYEDMVKDLPTLDEAISNNRDNLTPLEVPDLPTYESVDYSGNTILEALNNSSVNSGVLNNLINSQNELHKTIAESQKSYAESMVSLAETMKKTLDLHLQKSTKEDTQSDVDLAYKEAFLENSFRLLDVLSDVSSSLNASAQKDTSVSVNNENIIDTSPIADTLKDGVTINRSQDEIELTSKKLEHITFDTTPIQLDNLGDEIPKMTPQEMRAVKDAVTAKKNSDENTFDLDDDDIQDMFFMPDINEIFNFNKKSDRWTEIFNSLS